MEKREGVYNNTGENAKGIVTFDFGDVDDKDVPGSTVEKVFVDKRGLRISYSSRR